MKPASTPWRLSNLLASALLAGVLLGGIAEAAAPAASPSDDPIIADGPEWATGNSLYLVVTLNGVTRDRLAHFDERDGQLYVRAATLQALGFKPVPGAGDPVRLASLRGIAIAYDANAQHVSLTVPLDALELETTQLGATPESAPKATSSPGLLLNYDVYATTGHGSHSLAATTELRAFAGGRGVFDSTAIARYSRLSGQGWTNDVVRLDTNWQLPFPDSMLRLTIGDTLTGALDWTRSTRIAGISLGTDFGLQPYRVTTPLPAFFGSATLPSAVDLYINGIRQYSGHVEPGPFQLNAIPTINGIGSAQIVVTDALGRTSTLDLPLYATHRLLQPGLADWSASLGVVRENYGIESFDYGSDPVGHFSLRYGVSDHFTAEAHAEATNGLANAGVGGVLLLGNLGGVVSGSVAHSTLHGDAGSQFSLGYSWTGRHFHIGFDSLRTRGAFRDTASLYGFAPPRVSDRAVASVSTDSGASFGVNLLRQQYPQQSASRYAGAFWSDTFGGQLSLNLGFNQNLDEARDRSVFASITWAPDTRRSYTASVQRSRGQTSGTLQASQPVPGDGGFGWRAAAQVGGGSHGGVAEASWLDNRGQLTVGANTLGSTEYAYADAVGSLVLMGGHVFAARSIDDAFAVVSTDGVADVPVRLENREIGRTDSRGLLLVTRLNAYQRNSVSIDPMSLPANMHIDRVAADATPADHAGTLVRFDMRMQRAASIVLVDGQGHPLALGSGVRIDGKQDTGALIGFDGVVYLDNLDEHNVLLVRTPGASCRVRVDYPDHVTAGSVPELGPFACRQDAP